MNPKPATIADLISLDIKPEVRKRRKPVVTPLTASLLCPEGAKLPRKFECDVFNFLLERKDALGVGTVFKFKNLFVDGAVQLVDGRRLAVEVKLRMNWSKALQAESEFRRFLQTPEAKTHPVHGAIVFFESFKGAGWDRIAKSRLLENGWNQWYTYYSNIDGHRADLFRLAHGAVEHYNLVRLRRSIAAFEQLPGEDKATVLAAARVASPSRGESTRPALPSGGQG
jgi:hypothetical protein